MWASTSRFDSASWPPPSSLSLEKRKRFAVRRVASSAGLPHEASTWAANVVWPTPIFGPHVRALLQSFSGPPPPRGGEGGVAAPDLGPKRQVVFAELQRLPRRAERFVVLVGLDDGGPFHLPDAEGVEPGDPAVGDQPAIPAIARAGELRALLARDV